MNYPVGDNPKSVAIGDLDGDGKLDLAVADGFGTSVSILVNNGDGTFGLAAAVNYPVGLGPYCLVVGDLNGDGKPDIAVADANSNDMNILINNGNGTFAAGVSYATGPTPIFIAIGDVNGDGKPDLATANEGSTNASIYVNNGKGVFAAPVNYVVHYALI